MLHNGIVLMSMGIQTSISNRIAIKFKFSENFNGWTFSHVTALEWWRTMHEGIDGLLSLSMKLL